MDSISHYRILEKLGEGGMGEVYLAEDTHLHRKVAIKLLLAKSISDPNARKRLIREAQTAAVLKHPNTCIIYAVGKSEDTSFIVMEYIDGETLAERIKNRGLTLSESVDIAIHIADALTEAHSHNIVHRDIKPQNIIINARKKVKVLDFGLAKITQQNDGTPFEGETISALTGAGMIIGTAGYMSPEQAQGAKVDFRSDIFSLGVLLYECVTGHRAFTGTTFMEVCGKILHVNPPAPSKLDARVPQELDKIILRAIEKRPESRYQTAEALFTDLQAVREHLNNEELIKTQNAAHQKDTSRIFAWKTLTNVIYRPRFKPVAVALAILLALSAIYGIRKLSLSSTHQLSPEVKRLYNEGLNASHDGTYHTARKRFDLVVQADDKFALAHARLAEAWNELDYSNKASDHMLKALSLNQDISSYSPRDAFYVKAIHFSLIRNFSESINQYSEILKNTPEEEKYLVYFDLGRAYEKNEDVERAIASYEEALKNNPRYAGALLRLGVLYGRGTDFELADSKFKEAESIYEATGNPEGVTEAMLLHAIFLADKTKLAQGRDILNKALDQAKAFSNKAQQIKILTQLSDLDIQEGRLDEAQKLAEETVSIAQEDGLHNLSADALINIGFAFAVRGQTDVAENYFIQALQISQRYNGQVHEARSKLSLASLYLQKSNADEAINYAEQALPFYQKGGFDGQVSDALLIIGRANRLKGHFEEALNTFNQQLEIAKKLGDPLQLADSYSSIGTTHFYQENYLEALKAYQQNYQIVLSLNQPLRTGYSLLNLADLQWRMGNYKEGRELFSQAKVLAENQKIGQLRAWIHFYTARMLISERKFSEAAIECQQALKLGSEFKDIVIQAKSSLGLAQVFLRQKALGVQNCEEAEKLALANNNPRILASARLALAEALLQLGNPARVLEKAEQAKQDIDLLKEQDSAWRVRAIQAQALQVKGEMQIARANASEAMQLLTKLQQLWGKEALARFFDRPDVLHFQKQLEQILSSQ